MLCVRERGKRGKGDGTNGQEQRDEKGDRDREKVGVRYIELRRK